jgi:hypothetical protein
MHTHERTIGVVLLILAIAIATAATGYVLANWRPELTFDADRCPPSPAGTRLVLVDRTDVWPPQEQERIQKGLLAVAERMHKNTRLSLHAITGRAEDAAAPWKGFQRCKSDDPAFVDPTHENERLVRADYEQHFLEPLKALLPELTSGSAAAQSPILEVLEILMWSPHFRADVANRTLEIYSDLLHHTAALSHLTSSLPDPCTVLASTIGSRLKSHDWRSVRVVLHYLRNPRDAARQGDPHLRWWTRLFYLLGAAEVFDGSTRIVNDMPACPSDTGKTPRRATAKKQFRPADQQTGVAP